MIRTLASAAMLCVACQFTWAQQDEPQSAPAEPPEHQAVRQMLAQYLECFNSGDAATLAQCWTEDGLSVSQETGEQTSGRDALQQEFAAFFEANPGAHLNGELLSIRLIRPDVASIEGRTMLFAGEEEPVESAYTAIIVKENDRWRISSSHERDLPAPATPYDALKDLEWLVGTWQDQTEGAEVTNTVRWSPSQAFLIRSFSANFSEADSLQGTQIIGWDPLNKQIRSWTFNSDGSFGQGTLTRHDNDLMLKMWQITSDGKLASGTKVMTRVDDDTVTVETIGETIDGAPQPASEPVTVVRIAEVEGDESDAAPASDEGDNQ